MEKECEKKESKRKKGEKRRKTRKRKRRKTVLLVHASRYNCYENYTVPVTSMYPVCYNWPL